MAATLRGQPAALTPDAMPATSAAPIVAMVTVPGVSPSMPSLKLAASVVPRIKARYQTLNGTCASGPNQCASA